MRALRHGCVDLFGWVRHGRAIRPARATFNTAIPRAPQWPWPGRAAEHGIDPTGGRVLLLGYPSLLGYGFNRRLVYFCYAVGGELALMIHEVRNTFGALHAHVIPVRPPARSAMRA